MIGGASSTGLKKISGGNATGEKHIAFRAGRQVSLAKPSL